MSLRKCRVTTGWGDKHDVTCRYHTLFSQPPRNATSTHHDPRRLATRIHHHNRGMAMTTHEHPRAPSTTINEWQWWPTGHEDPPPRSTSTQNGHKGPPPPSTNGHEGRPEQRETRKVCGRTSLHFDPPWLTLPSMLRWMVIPMSLSTRSRWAMWLLSPSPSLTQEDGGHITVSGMANNNHRTTMTTHTWTITTHTWTTTTTIHGRTMTDGIHTNNNDNSTRTNNNRWHRLTMTWCVNG